MPFLDHLEELRWRIIWSLASAFVGIVIGFVVVSQVDFVLYLERPILPYLSGHTLVYTHPGDPFQIFLNAALIIGSVIASPMIFYQIWAFLAPGLHAHERTTAIGVLVAGAALFVTGAALAFYVVIPLSIPWLMGFGGKGLTPMITAGEYFGFAYGMIATFGLSFELPIVVLGLAAFGLVTPAFLAKYRRHAFVLIVVAAAFLTPGDLVTTTIILTVPMYGLYELSIIAAVLMNRRRNKPDQVDAGAESLTNDGHRA